MNAPFTRATFLALLTEKWLTEAELHILAKAGITTVGDLFDDDRLARLGLQPGTLNGHALEVTIDALRTLVLTSEAPIGGRLALSEADCPQDEAAFDHPDFEPEHDGSIGLSIPRRLLPGLVRIIAASTDPAARDLLTLIGKTAADAAPLLPALDPALDQAMAAVTWTPGKGGYRVRVPSQAGPTAIPVLARWDSDVLGAKVSLVMEFPRYTGARFTAWIDLDEPTCRFLAEGNTLSRVMRSAVRRRLAQLPATAMNGHATIAENERLPASQKLLS